MNIKTNYARQQDSKPADGESALNDGLCRRLAIWISGHPSKYGGDHACADCYPSGDIIHHGFVCAYHEAMQYIKRHNVKLTRPPTDAKQTEK